MLLGCIHLLIVSILIESHFYPSLIDDGDKKSLLADDAFYNNTARFLLFALKKTSFNLSKNSS